MLHHHQLALASASGRRLAAAFAKPTAATTTARRRARSGRAPMAVAAASSAALADAPEQQQQQTTKPNSSVVVRPYSGDSELHAVARLRAEAYHESDSSRFAATFKKQFAEREAASLRQRTAAVAGRVGPPRCECLVAVADAGDNISSSASTQEEVLGCIDLRPPPHAAASPGSTTSGVPPEDAASGAYLLNVVVSEKARGKGVGEALMRAAMRRARREHGAERAYTHVEAGNGSAARLYARCGFEESGEERGALAGASELGRVLLLRADLGGLDGEE
jgi:ribosomal protein S18 acetylase RimI-like enzyme